MQRRPNWHDGAETEAILAANLFWGAANSPVHNGGMQRGKDFAKKEEMIRHSKWHQKMDEALKYGFRRVTPMDDCSDQFIDCTHNKKQTHYHCIQSDGCDKVYISTSDVQMHFNYHRKEVVPVPESFRSRFA